eukprot:2989385-Amphidinium_carterae.1
MESVQRLPTVCSNQCDREREPRAFGAFDEAFYTNPEALVEAQQTIEERIKMEHGERRLYAIIRRSVTRTELSRPAFRYAP